MKFKGNLQVNQSEELSSYVVDTGVADAYVITLRPAPLVYTAGLEATFQAVNANTGASTINVNGLGVKSIKKNVSTALAAGDILANQIITLIYDGTNFQLYAPTSGGSGSITADSGLTANTSTNVQLGGTSAPGRALLHNTYINNDGYTLTLTSASDSASVFSIINTGTAYSTLISAPYGLYISSTNNGIVVTAGDRPLQSIITGDGYAASLLRTYNNTNTVNGVLSLSHDTSGTAANGFGTSIDISLATSSGASWASNKIISKWTTATTASRTSEFSITGVSNAVTNTLLTISGAGIFTLSQGLSNYANDAAAASGGIAVNQLYRNGSVVMIRVS